MRAAEDLRGDRNRITVGIDCRRSIGRGIDGIVGDAEDRHLVARHRHAVFDPFRVKRQIFRGHRGKRIFVCQRTVEPADHRLFFPTRFRQGQRRVILQRDRRDRAAAVRYEGQGEPVDLPVCGKGKIARSTLRYRDGGFGGLAVPTRPAEEDIPLAFRSGEREGGALDRVGRGIARRPAVKIVGDRVGVRPPDRRKRQILRLRRIDRGDLGRANAPLDEIVVLSRRRIERKRPAVDRIRLRVAFVVRPAVKIVGDRVGIDLPVRGITLVARRTPRDRNVLLGRFAVRTGPAEESIARSRRIRQRERIALDRVGRGIACRPAVHSVGDRVRVRPPDRRDRQILRLRGVDRSNFVRADAPLDEIVVLSRRRIERQRSAVDRIRLRVAFVVRPAVHGVGDRVGRYLPVRGITLIARRSFRDGHALLGRRAVRTGPAEESIARSRRIRQRERIALDRVGRGIARRPAAEGVRDRIGDGFPRRRQRNVCHPRRIDGGHRAAVLFPALEGIARTGRIFQGDRSAFHGITLRVGGIVGPARKIVTDRVGRCFPVCRIDLIALRSFRNGHVLLGRRAVRSGPAEELVARLCRGGQGISVRDLIGGQIGSRTAVVVVRNVVTALFPSCRQGIVVVRHHEGIDRVGRDQNAVLVKPPQEPHVGFGIGGDLNVRGIAFVQRLLIVVYRSRTDLDLPVLGIVDFERQFVRFRLEIGDQRDVFAPHFAVILFL